MEKGADFETAISATGVGKYNILLILIAIPAGWGSLFASTTMSYVFPVAQCDLDLDLNDKGLLNAITYTGMISSAMIWGFLVDTLGRKKLLYVGFFIDFLFQLMSASAQTKTVLMASKFLQGIIINGPFAAFTSYLAEFHSTKNRPRMQLLLGFIYALAGVFLPLLAWFVMSKEIEFSFWNLNFHSWNLYLIICSLPSLISAVIFVVMPESPKFLMTIGQNGKALEVFRTIYAINTGHPKDTYPITKLVEEIDTSTKRKAFQALKDGFQQMKPLFLKPHLRNLILACLMQTCLLMSLNTLRLWLPQIFQSMSDYELSTNETSGTLCDVLDFIRPSNQTEQKCFVNPTDPYVYMNSLVVSSVSMCTYVITAFIINRLGKKRLLFLYCTIAGSSILSMYFATSTPSVLVLAAGFHSTSSVGSNVILSVIIDMFPTTLRTMTISIVMMMARLGSVLGNLVFPILVTMGCLPPFLVLAIALFVCVISVFFLPNTESKALT